MNSHERLLKGVNTGLYTQDLAKWGTQTAELLREGELEGVNLSAVAGIGKTKAIFVRLRASGPSAGGSQLGIARPCTV